MNETFLPSLPTTDVTFSFTLDGVPSSVHFMTTDARQLAVILTGLRVLLAELKATQ